MQSLKTKLEYRELYELGRVIAQFQDLKTKSEKDKELYLAKMNKIQKKYKRFKKASENRG